MRITNRVTIGELRSDNPIEAKALFTASHRSYSARASGLMPNGDQMVMLLPEEAEEFASGVLRDVDIERHCKWQVAKLIAVWLSGEIKPKDEGIAL